MNGLSRYIAIIFFVIFPVISLANCPPGKFGNCGPGGELNIPPDAPIRDPAKMATCPFQGQVRWYSNTTNCYDWEIGGTGYYCTHTTPDNGYHYFYFMWRPQLGAGRTYGHADGQVGDHGHGPDNPNYSYFQDSRYDRIHYCYMSGPGLEGDSGLLVIKLYQRNSPCKNPEKYGQTGYSYSGYEDVFAYNVFKSLYITSAAWFHSVAPIADYPYPDPDCVANMFNPAPPPGGDDDDCENLRITINPPFYPSTVRVNCN